MATEVERLREQTSELEENQRRLALIYDTVRDVIFQLAVEPDSQFRFVSVNAAFLKVTGLSREAVVGRTVNEVIPEPSLTMVLEKYRLAIEERTTVLWEETSDYPTGRLTGEVAVTPVFDNAGKCTHLVGSVHDVTERKRNEAVLCESEEHFRNLANSAPVMIWVTGPDNRATFFNRCCLAFTGRSMEEKLGDGWVAGLYSTDRGPFLAVFASAFDARQEFRSIFRLRRADGEYRWVLCTGVPNFAPSGVFSGYIGSCIDITEQKLIEERLRASEARLMNAQRLARVGSWERDIANDRINWSDQVLGIMGVADKPPSNLQAFLNCVHPEDRGKILQASSQARSKNGPVDVEYRIVRPDGETRSVRSMIEVIRDNQDIPLRVTGATQDITDFRRNQEESFARQKLESVGTLARGIAHDFNNLLGGVLAQSELALAELDAGSHPKDELAAIRDLALRGSEIVRQLMVYAGEESATVGPVDLSRIVKEMTELLKVSVSKHAILETDLGNDLPAVQADAAQLRQIVMNLVTNASEAIENRDGVIRVTTRCAGDTAGTSGTPPESDYVILEVYDTGCGMSHETQARVFDPFFTTKPAGHGLGLAIVDGIVRSLQGKIHLESEPGKGTTFHILLPCSGITSIPEPLSPVEEVAHFSEWATVLVVEDEDILRQVAAKVLRRSGFEVLEAANGSAAIDVLRVSVSKIDVILLDMTIPGPSSHEVVAEYAKVRSDAKVILTSAYSEETARKTMNVPQIRGFIRKPFNLRVLVETLRKTLSHSSEQPTQKR
jgi:two-component system, cell cycle sensor histidine kinase and response regulator CckA